jgi:hypothetical protein
LTRWAGRRSIPAIGRWLMPRLGVALLLVVTVSILTAPLAEAQPVAKVPRIGVLRPGLPFDPYVACLTRRVA